MTFSKNTLYVMSLYSMCPPIPATSYVAVFFLTEAKKNYMRRNNEWQRSSSFWYCIHRQFFIYKCKVEKWFLQYGRSSIFINAILYPKENIATWGSSFLYNKYPSYSVSKPFRTLVCNIDSRKSGLALINLPLGNVT